MPGPRRMRRRSRCRRTRVSTRVRARGRATFTLLGSGRARGGLLPTPQGVRDTNAERSTAGAGFILSGFLAQLVSDGDAERRDDRDVHAERGAQEPLALGFVVDAHARPAIKWRGIE